MIVLLCITGYRTGNMAASWTLGAFFFLNIPVIIIILFKNQQK